MAVVRTYQADVLKDLDQSEELTPEADMELKILPSVPQTRRPVPLANLWLLTLPSV